MRAGTTPREKEASVVDTKGLRAYLISPSELKPDWLTLYAATFAIQLVLASLRGGIAYVALWLLFKLAGEPTGYLHPIVARCVTPWKLCFSTGKQDKRETCAQPIDIHDSMVYGRHLMASA